MRDARDLKDELSQAHDQRRELQAENARLRTALLALVGGHFDDELAEGVMHAVGDDAFNEAHRLGLIASRQDMSGEYETHLTQAGDGYIVAALTSRAEARDA